MLELLDHNTKVALVFIAVCAAASVGVIVATVVEAILRKDPK